MALRKGQRCKVDSGLLSGALCQIVKLLDSGDYSVKLLCDHGAWSAGDTVQLAGYELRELSEVVDNRAANASAKLLYWQRKAKLAANKVKHYRKKVLYYKRRQGYK